jgi:hypothetical protein
VHIFVRPLIFFFPCIGAEAHVNSFLETNRQRIKNDLSSLFIECFSSTPYYVEAK